VRRFLCCWFDLIESKSLDGCNSAELTNLIGSGNPNFDVLQHIQPEIAQNPAVFPGRAQQAKLEMLRDLDRH
jgi:spermidine/putrescine transport system substrate-binding protein